MVEHCISMIFYNSDCHYFDHSLIVSMGDNRTKSPHGQQTLNDLIRSDFWFHDGNIVIIAGNAVFKVHKGQLERHSDIFNVLFSIPQPGFHELIDGCRYVELNDDPSDVFYFLSALYDGLYASFTNLGAIRWLTGTS
jgi:hypothetical protein